MTQPKYSHEFYMHDIPKDVVLTLPTGIVCIDTEFVAKGAKSEYSPDAEGEPWWSHPSKGLLGAITMYWPGYERVVTISLPSLPCPGLRAYSKEEGVSPIFHYRTIDEEYLRYHLSVQFPTGKDTRVLAKMVGEPSPSLFDLLKKYIGDIDDLPNKGRRCSNWNKPYSRWDDEMKKYVAQDVLYLDTLHSILLAQATPLIHIEYTKVMQAFPSLLHLRLNHSYKTFGDLDFMINYDTPYISQK